MAIWAGIPNASDDSDFGDRIKQYVIVSKSFPQGIHRFILQIYGVISKSHVCNHCDYSMVSDYIPVVILCII